MKHIKTILLTFLTALLSLPAYAKSTVALATPEQLAAAGLSSNPVEIPGGTVLFDNDIATFSLAYTDEWGTDVNYGIHNASSSSYRLKVGDSQEFTIGVSPAGQTNPAFSGYENGVMSTGSVFKIDAKQTGWITVFTILFNPDKKYVVFENETKGVPYTLGGSDGEYKINYCLPMATTGENAGYVNLDDLNSERYFQVMGSGNHRPESPYITAGMESAPGYGMGYITFHVTTGNSYYVSALGSRLLCQGYVFSDDDTEPSVTFLATGDLPEVNFGIRGTIPLMTGEHFEDKGLVYTVTDAEAKTVKTKDGIGDTYLDHHPDYTAGNNVEGDIIIPSVVTYNGVDYTVTEIGFSGFCNQKKLRSVVIPETVKEIGSFAFCGCSSLESINIPAGIEVLQWYVLNGCSNLKSIDLPESLTLIREHAFADCSNLETAQIPESVIQMDYAAFSNCKGLASVNLPSSLTSIGNSIFMGCDNLSEISYSATELCSAEDNVFEDEAYRKAILNTPNATLASVQSTVPWSKFLRVNAKDGSIAPAGQGEDFKYEGLLYTVIDANAKTCRTKAGRSVDGVGYAGNECDGDVIIPSIVSDGVYEYMVVEIGYRGFADTSITSVVLPESLLEISRDAFSGCHDLVNVVLPPTLSTIGHAAFIECLSLSSVSIPASVTSIEDRAFDYCNALESISYLAETPVSANVDIFPTVIYRDATLNTPNATLESVKATMPWNQFLRVNAKDGSIAPAGQGEDFEYEGLWYTVIDVNAKTCRTRAGGSVDGVEYAGNECEGDVIIPSIVSDGLFEYTVVEIGGYGFAETSITSVTLPESISTINGRAFINCFELSSVRLSDSVTKIGEYAFYGCSNLSSISLPESLKTIESAAFERCSALPTVVIPESITSIGANAFYNCTSLKSVSLPNTMPACVYGLFGESKNITEVAYYAEAPVASVEDLFDNLTYETATLKTPNATLASVQATVPWNKFLRVNAKDGSIAPAGQGDDFEYEGLWYTVIDANAKTCRTKAGGSVDGVGYAGNECEGDVIIPSIVSDGVYEYAVVEIGYRGFADTSITSVILPETLLAIGREGFGGCHDLASVVLPPQLSTIGQAALIECLSLPSISIPASVTSIENRAFDYCNALESISYLAETPVSANVDIFPTVIYRDATLNTPNATLESVKATMPWDQFLRVNAKDGSIAPAGQGEDFEYEGLWYTVIDADAKTCRTKAGTLVDDMYVAGNTVSGDLVIPPMVSDGIYDYSVVEIGWCGFANCSGLTSLRLSDSVTKIGGYAFYGCSNLSSISLPESLKTIESAAFERCAALTTVVIPESITSIGANVFYNCTSLKSVSLPNTMPACEYGLFGGSKNILDVTYLAETPVASVEDLFDNLTYEIATLMTPNATLASVQATMPWNHFYNINASDGSLRIPRNGDDFDFDGITYTVIDDETNLLQTKAGTAEEGVMGNVVEGNIVIPETVSAYDREYTVTEIGDYSFGGNSNLLSVTIPATVEHIGTGAFSDCERLTSLVWKGHTPLQNGVVEEIGNPNLLLYVDSVQYAPEGMDHNIVADGICENLVLTPGYPFTPLVQFTAEHSEITKEFTQLTPTGGCAGWETLAIPFQPTEITSADGRQLVPFGAFTDIYTQCPFWLYEADATGEWREASAIRQTIPYLVSMPDNDSYDEQYRIHGDVKFSTDDATVIAPATTAPYITTWASGREFRSLWLPLDDAEAADAMGLNVGIDDLRNNDGEFLAPGSAFHVDVLPRPLEAYVTRIDGRRYMPVRGDQSFLKLISGDNGLKIVVKQGTIILSSDYDRTVDVVTMDGVTLRRAHLKGGVAYRIENLTRGIYIVAGRKITVK